MLDFSAMPIATFKNVSIAFGKDEILSGADLVVHHGEHLALAGRNGAGKSTTLKLISGELKNDGGEIWTEKDLKFVSLPQQLPIATEESVFTAVSSVFEELGKVISEYQVLAQTIKVDKSGINNAESQSKIIRIALQTPILGEALTNINNLNTGELSWFNESSNKSIDEKSYEIIYKNDTLKPWILILKR